MATETVLDEPQPVPGEPKRRSIGHRFFKGVLWILVVAWLVFAGLRIFSDDANWVVVAAMAYTPYVMFGGLVLAVCAIPLRAGVAFTGALLSVMALVAVVVPRMIATDQPVVDGTQLTVMTVNLRVGAGDADDVMSLVRQHDVDILSVQELTEASVDALDAAGLTEYFPHQEYVATTDDASGTGVFSTVPVVSLAAVPGRFHMPTVWVHLPGGANVHFTAVHTAPPVGPSLTEQWRNDLAALPSARRDGPIEIMAGDFNSTLDHEALRDLIGTGYIDAADATGDGMTGTWQPMGALGTILPRVRLDRVLVDDRVAVRDVSVHHVAGTDHRAVVAVLQLP